MKQVVSNYSYSPATNVLTLSGVNIDQDQLLLVVAPSVGRTMYNFASGVTGVVSAGVNTRVTLNASTASLTTTSPLVIYYDDQAISGTVTIGNLGDQITTLWADNAVNDISTAVLNGIGGYINGNDYFPIEGTVSVANSVTISALPVSLSTTTIGGTARLNVTLSSATTIGATAPSYGNLYGGSDGTNLRAISVDTSGRTVVTGSTSILGTPSVTMGAISGTVTANVRGTVPVSISSVTIGNTVTVAGTITASLFNAQAELGENAPSQAVQIGGYNLADNKIYPFNVDSNGIQKVEARPLQSSSTSITTFTETTSSTVLAPDATRKGIVFYVSGAGSAFISLGSSETSTSEYSIVASENDIANISGYTGEITGLVTGDAVLHITELS